jgi:hypothetical protein
MDDIIYTPHEMLDRVEARCHVLRAELIQIDTYIDAAQRDGDTNALRSLAAERGMCVADIAYIFQKVV